MSPARVVWLSLLLTCQGLAALPVYNTAALQGWWASHGITTDYPAEAAKLQSALQAAQEAGAEDVRATVNGINFQGWVELAAWLHLFPGAAENSFLNSAEGRATFARVGANVNLRQQFLTNLSAFDDAGRAVEIYCRIAHAAPEACQRWPQLAAAFAFVWDQPFPAEWPHAFVDAKKLPRGDSDPVARFQALCQLGPGVTIKPGEVRKFLIDPAKLSARDLMFVVDTPLEFKELNYVLQIKLSDPTRLNDLFPQVPYDAARMSRGELLWPHESYRLIDIGKQGGICADQAYFVAMAGKAQGLPTVLLFGQGTTGGHAWVGYQGRPGQWTLNVARYREGNYTSGRTYDPQTWRTITDTQLAFLTQDPVTPATALRGRLLMHWAQQNHAAASYPVLLGLARSAWPHSFDIWELQAQCLADRQMPALACQGFWEHWTETFRDDRDLRFRGQSELLKLHEANGNPAAATALRTQMMAENKHARFDLAISLAAAPVFALVQANHWPEAQQIFLTVLKGSGKEAGGSLFYNLVQSYVEQAVQAGQKELARTAWQRAKPLFNAPPLSTLAVDFKTLEASLPPP